MCPCLALSLSSGNTHEGDSDGVESSKARSAIYFVLHWGRASYGQSLQSVGVYSRNPQKSRKIVFVRANRRTTIIALGRGTQRQERLNNQPRMVEDERCETHAVGRGATLAFRELARGQLKRSPKLNNLIRLPFAPLRDRLQTCTVGMLCDIRTNHSLFPSINGPFPQSRRQSAGG
jgi:hypothetical protein